MKKPQIWSSCMFAVAFGSGDEFAYMLREVDEVENLGCEKDAVVIDGKHEVVKLTDRSTVARLDKTSCEGCRYFEKR